MKPYLELMRRIRDTGIRKDDRTGTGTLSVFGHQMRFDLSEGFPLTPYNRATFYAGEEKGYTDYPAYDEMAPA